MMLWQRAAALAALLVAAAAVVLPRPSPAQAVSDSASAVRRAHEISEWVRAGDSARLWSAMSPDMKQAMRDSAAFAASTASIMAQIGALDSVVSEQIRGGEALWIYRAEARFTRAPALLQLAIALDAEGALKGLSVQPGPRTREYPSPFVEYACRTSLRLPFEDEWFVFWGGRTLEQNHHAGMRAQRFALDLVIRRDGRTHSGEGRALTDYFCYGAPILAPAAGVVVWSENGHPDQPIGSTDAAHPIGNGLVLDHGNGEFSLFAHLQPGTQRFEVGDRVTANARIGLTGNSGNTSEPHLHYQLQNGADPVASDGLPAAFSDLVIDDAPAARAELQRGQRVRRAPAKTRR